MTVSISRSSSKRRRSCSRRGLSPVMRSNSLHFSCSRVSSGSQNAATSTPGFFASNRICWRPRPPMPITATRIRSLGATSADGAINRVPTASAAPVTKSLRFIDISKTSLKDSKYSPQSDGRTLRFHTARCRIHEFYRLERFRVRRVASSPRRSARFQLQEDGNCPPPSGAK